MGPVMTCRPSAGACSLGLAVVVLMVSVSVAAAQPPAGPTNTWTGLPSTNGTVNWTPGLWNANPGAGSPTTVLQFTSVGTSQYTAQNNNGAVTVNGLIFNSPNPDISTSTAIGNATASHTITLGGANPFIYSTGSGYTTFDTTVNLNLAATSGTPTVGGNAGGVIDFAGYLTGTAGLRIDAMGGAGYVSLQGNILGVNTSFSGGVTLGPGAVLLLSGSQALGVQGSPNAITLAGSATVRNAVDYVSSTSLQADVNLGTNTLTWDGPRQVVIQPTGVAAGGTFSGTGGFTYAGTNTFEFQRVTPYSGATRVTNPGQLTTASANYGTIAPVGGTLALSGSDGSLSATSAVVIRTGTLQLGGVAIAAPNPGMTAGRLADDLTITLHRSTFRMKVLSSASAEVVGTIRGTGYNILDVNGSDGSFANSTQLRAAQIVRDAHATYGVFGFGLGTTPGSSGSANVRLATLTPLVGAGSGSFGAKVVPFAVGKTAGSVAQPDTLVTYVGTGTTTDVGFKPLQTTDYNIYTAALTTDNVLITAGGALSAKTINALLVQNSTGSAYTLAGLGVLNVTSGAVLFTGAQGVTVNGFTSVDVSPAGGGNPTELILTTFNTSSAGVTIASPIGPNTTGGLTKSGFGRLTLTAAANNYSGGTFINAGILSYAADAQLGTGDVTLSGGSLGFTGNNYTFTRGLVVREGGGGVDVSSGKTLTLAPGLLSGDGYLFKSGTGTLALTGANNAYTGTRIVIDGSGTLAIDGPAALGTAGPAQTIELGAGTAGTLKFLANAPAFDRGLNAAGSATIDTNGFAVTATGLVTGSGALIKVGTGTLTLAQGSTRSGSTTVSGGTLRIANPAGTSATGSGTVVATTGGTLTGSGTIALAATAGLFVDGTLAPGAGTAGRLTVLGGGTSAAVTFQPASKWQIGIGAPVNGGSAAALNSGQNSAADPAANAGFLEVLNRTAPLVVNNGTVIKLTGDNTQFTPYQPYSYQVATVPAGSTIGTVTFDTTAFPVYNTSLNVVGTSVYLNFTPVPEPATALGIAGAALGLVAAIRRRRTA